MFTDPEKAKAVFLGWLIEHPSVKPTLANSTLFADYLRTNGLPCTSKSLDAAYASLKATGKLPGTPEEIEAARVEGIRQQIYAAVASKILPAKLNWNDWNGTLGPLSKFVRDNYDNHLTVDTLHAAIVSLKLSLPWVVEPQGLDKARRAAELGFDDSRDEVGTRRYNHADSDRIRAEINAKKKKFMADAQTEGRAEELQVIESVISDYQANAGPLNRPNRGQTSFVQELLRSYAKKFNSTAKEIRNLIRDLTGESSDITLLRRRLEQAAPTQTAEPSEPPAPRIGPPTIQLA